MSSTSKATKGFSQNAATLETGWCKTHVVWRQRDVSFGHGKRSQKINHPLYISRSSPNLEIQSRTKASTRNTAFGRIDKLADIVSYPLSAAPTRSWQALTMASTKEFACSADSVCLKLLRRIDTTTLFLSSPRRSASLQI